MKRTKQKILSVLLMLAMVFSVVPLAGFADAEQTQSVDAGVYGAGQSTPQRSGIQPMSDPVTGAGYSFDPDTGELTITASAGFDGWKSNTAIAADAAARYAAIQSVVVVSGITAVPANAFSNTISKVYCTALTSVSLPEGLLSVGNFAFFRCSALTGINLPDGLLSIGNSVFAVCSSLTGIAIPDTVTSIGAQAFIECGQLKTVHFPAALNSMDVDGVFAISGLESADLSACTGLKVIGPNTFYDCPALSNVILPPNLTTLKEWAFEECTSLTAITLPSTLTSIGEGAFNNDAALAALTFESFNAPAFTNLDFAKGILGSFVGLPSVGTVTYPNNGPGYTLAAFNAAALPGQFNGWTFTPASAVINGDGYTFDFDTMTLTVSSNAGSTNWRTDARLGSTTSQRAALVENLIIGSGVTAIGDYAFNSCGNLQGVTIPSGVTSIGDQAFSNCPGLISVTVPDTVTSLGTSVFMNDIGLLSATLSAGLSGTGNYTFDGCKSLQSVVIPEGITTIGMYAFMNCISLSTLQIPASVTAIGAFGEPAFLYCNALTAFAVDPDNQNYVSVDGVLFNKAKTELICYPAAKAGTDYAVPGTVGTIKSYSFDGCSVLKNLQLPDSVVSIGGSAFVRSDIETIYVGSTAASKIASVGLAPFAVSLESVYFTAIAPPTFSVVGTFGSAATTTVYVPEGREAAYLAAMTGLGPHPSGVNVVAGSASVFVPVTSITGIPAAIPAGVLIELNATVLPADASNKTIDWSVKNAGTTDADILTNFSYFDGKLIKKPYLSTSSAGIVTLTAKIENGLTPITDYLQDFTITVNAPGGEDDGGGDGNGSGGTGDGNGGDGGNGNDNGGNGENGGEQPVKLLEQPVTADRIAAAKTPTAPGETVKLPLTIDFGGGHQADVTWTSNTPSIAMVDAKGNLTGVSEGMTELTATSKSKPAKKITITVTIAKNVTAIRSPLKALYLKKGKPIVPPVDFDGKDASGRVWGYKGYGAAPRLTWKSSKPKIAAVNAATGKITPKKKGTAKITATALNGKKLTFTVKVVPKAKKLSKLTLSKPPKTMAKAKTKILKVKVTSGKSTNLKVTFKSSKTSVIKVDKAGKLFPLKKGTAKITVKAGGKQKVITVKVK
jgi:uncharacterized protein YjdB